MEIKVHAAHRGVFWHVSIETESCGKTSLLGGLTCSENEYRLFKSTFKADAWDEVYVPRHQVKQSEFLTEG